MLERTQIAINNDASESSEIREESGRENVHLPREQVNNHIQNIGRNRNPMGDSAQISDGNEEKFLGQWMKVNPHHKVAMNLA